jgi:hypothetical protein
MKIRKVLIILLLTAGIVLAACTPAASPIAGESSGSPTNAPTIVPTEILTQTPSNETVSIADLKNGTYLIDGQSITLVDGVAENELAPGSASKQITRYFGNEVNIDLNSDGLMDAAFLLQQETGGSGTFYYVVAALKTENGYVGTNAIFLGDRIAPQSTNVDPNNPSQFIVNYADRNADEPMSAQPTVGVSKTFKLENGSLVEVTTSS